MKLRNVFKTGCFEEAACFLYLLVQNDWSQSNVLILTGI